MGYEMIISKTFFGAVHKSSGTKGMRCNNRDPVDGIDNPVAQITAENIELFGFHILNRCTVLQQKFSKRDRFMELDLDSSISIC